MTFKQLQLLAIFFLAAATTNFAVAEEWTLAKEKNGVSIWTSAISGQRVNSYRAETTLNEPLEDVLAALRDVNRYSEWMSDCKEGRTFNEEDQHNYSTYMLWDLPFPFKDREFVQQVSITQLPGEVRMRVMPIPTAMPENDKYVRVQSAQIEWLLLSEENNHTKAVQTGYADPAGRLPAGMVNRFVENGPYQTMLELRDWLSKQHKLEAAAGR